MGLFLIYCNDKVAKKSARNSIEKISLLIIKQFFCYYKYKEDIQSFLYKKNILDLLDLKCQECKRKYSCI